MAAITGASGFVGRALCARLLAERYEVAALSRSGGAVPGTRQCLVASFDDDDALRSAFRGADCVVHLAARVHVMKDTTADPLAEFRRINVRGSLNVAKAAAAAGVRRLVFVSSIKVNGESTDAGFPFKASDPPAPADPYGVSKYEAEVGLRELAQTTGLELVIVRPVLVYGPGVKGNFLTMMKWVQRMVPLPLGAVDNLRSLVGLDNLVDLIAVCTSSPAAAGCTFLVSDGEDVSTAELIRRIAEAMGKCALLLPVPPAFLRAGAALLGKGEEGRRILGSLQVDIGETRRVLGWAPPFTMKDQLRSAVSSFLASANR